MSPSSRHQRGRRARDGNRCQLHALLSCRPGGRRLVRHDNNQVVKIYFAEAFAAASTATGCLFFIKSLSILLLSLSTSSSYDFDGVLLVEAAYSASVYGQHPTLHDLWLAKARADADRVKLKRGDEQTQTEFNAIARENISRERVATAAVEAECVWRARDQQQQQQAAAAWSRCSGNVVEHQKGAARPHELHQRTAAPAVVHPDPVPGSGVSRGAPSPSMQEAASPSQDVNDRFFELWARHANNLLPSTSGTTETTLLQNPREQTGAAGGGAQSCSSSPALLAPVPMPAPSPPDLYYDVYQSRSSSHAQNLQHPSSSGGSSAAGATSKSTPSAASARLQKLIQGEIASRKLSTSTRNRIKREVGDDVAPATEGREMSTATSSMMTGGSYCRYDISTTRPIATDEGRLATLRLPYNNFQEGPSTSGVGQLSASAPSLSASAAPSLANTRYQQTQISPSRAAMGVPAFLFAPTPATSTTQEHTGENITGEKLTSSDAQVGGVASSSSGISGRRIPPTAVAPDYSAASLPRVPPKELLRIPVKHGRLAFERSTAVGEQTGPEVPGGAAERRTAVDLPEPQQERPRPAPLPLGSPRDEEESVGAAMSLMSSASMIKNNPTSSETCGSNAYNFTGVLQGARTCSFTPSSTTTSKSTALPFTSSIQSVLSPSSDFTGRSCASGSGNRNLLHAAEDGTTQAKVDSTTSVGIGSMLSKNKTGTNNLLSRSLGILQSAATACAVPEMSSGSSSSCRGAANIFGAGPHRQQAGARTSSSALGRFGMAQSPAARVSLRKRTEDALFSSGRGKQVQEGRRVDPPLEIQPSVYERSVSDPAQLQQMQECLRLEHEDPAYSATTSSCCQLHDSTNMSCTSPCLGLADTDTLSSRASPPRSSIHSLLQVERYQM